jgi:hypothetical protein
MSGKHHTIAIHASAGNRAGVSWIRKDVFALYLNIIFELQMQYETTIDLSQQLVTQHADGFSDPCFVDGSDLVAKSS